MSAPGCCPVQAPPPPPSSSSGLGEPPGRQQDPWDPRGKAAQKPALAVLPFPSGATTTAAAAPPPPWGPEQGRALGPAAPVGQALLLLPPPAPPERLGQGWARDGSLPRRELPPLPQPEREGSPPRKTPRGSLGGTCGLPVGGAEEGERHRKWLDTPPWVMPGHPGDQSQPQGAPLGRAGMKREWGNPPRLSGQPSPSGERRGSPRRLGRAEEAPWEGRREPATHRQGQEEEKSSHAVAGDVRSPLDGTPSCSVASPSVCLEPWSPCEAVVRWWLMCHKVVASRDVEYLTEDYFRNMVSPCPRPLLPNRASELPVLNEDVQRLFKQKKSRPSSVADSSFCAIHHDLLSMLGPAMLIQEKAEEAAARAERLDPKELWDWARLLLYHISSINQAVNRMRRWHVLWLIDRWLTTFSYLGLESESTEGKLFAEDKAKQLVAMVASQVSFNRRLPAAAAATSRPGDQAIVATCHPTDSYSASHGPSTGSPPAEQTLPDGAACPQRVRASGSQAGSTRSSPESRGRESPGPRGAGRRENPAGNEGAWGDPAGDPSRGIGGQNPLPLQCRRLEGAGREPSWAGERSVWGGSPTGLGRGQRPEEGRALLGSCEEAAGGGGAGQFPEWSSGPPQGASRSPAAPSSSQQEWGPSEPALPGQPQCQPVPAHPALQPLPSFGPHPLRPPPSTEPTPFVLLQSPPAPGWRLPTPWGGPLWEPGREHPTSWGQTGEELQALPQGRGQGPLPGNPGGSRSPMWGPSWATSSPTRPLGEQGQADPGSSEGGSGEPAWQGPGGTPLRFGGVRSPEGGPAGPGSHGQGEEEEEEGARRKRSGAGGHPEFSSCPPQEASDQQEWLPCAPVVQWWLQCQEILDAPTQHRLLDLLPHLLPDEVAEPAVLNGEVWALLSQEGKRQYRSAVAPFCEIQWDALRLAGPALFLHDTVQQAAKRQERVHPAALREGARLLLRLVGSLNQKAIALRQACVPGRLRQGPPRGGGEEAAPGGQPGSSDQLWRAVSRKASGKLATWVPSKAALQWWRKCQTAWNAPQRKSLLAACPSPVLPPGGAPVPYAWVCPQHGSQKKQRGCCGCSAWKFWFFSQQELLALLGSAMAIYQRAVEAYEPLEPQGLCRWAQLLPNHVGAISCQANCMRRWHLLHTLQPSLVKRLPQMFRPGPAGQLFAEKDVRLLMEAMSSHLEQLRARPSVCLEGLLEYQQRSGASPAAGGPEPTARPSPGDHQVQQKHHGGPGGPSGAWE